MFCMLRIFSTSWLAFCLALFCHQTVFVKSDGNVEDYESPYTMYVDVNQNLVPIEDFPGQYEDSELLDSDADLETSVADALSHLMREEGKFSQRFPEEKRHTETIYGDFRTKQNRYRLALLRQNLVKGLLARNNRFNLDSAKSYESKRDHRLTSMRAALEQQKLWRKKNKLLKSLMG